jgi:hypothetical protein
LLIEAYKILDASVTGRFDIVGEITGRKFTCTPMVLKAFTTDSFSAA